MSSLSFADKMTLENFLNMSGGYVLNLSNRDFEELVEDAVKINVEDDRFNTKGRSKANRLRMVWKLESDTATSRLINTLVDYAMRSENSPTTEMIAMEPRCRQIAASLCAVNCNSLDPVLASVFINYRRDDASAQAHLVHECLKNRLGAKEVFMDVSSISPGVKWPEEIEKNLGSATTLVAVIGPSWLSSRIDEHGRRRIDDETDWVRRELEDALNGGKRVIPLLVNGAKVPPDAALPESLRGLFQHQYIEIRRDNWDHDIKQLENAFPAIASSQTSPRSGASGDGTISSPSSVKIKRERDVEQLREVFQWLSLGAIDRFIYHILNTGWITNEGHFLWEKLCWLMESSKYHLSDIELRNLFVSFMREWSVCFENFLDMEQHRNGIAFYFDVRGSEREYVRQHNQRAQYNGRQAEPIKTALGAFLDYVREHYLEIDLRMAGQRGLEEYKNDEALTKKIIKQQGQL